MIQHIKISKVSLFLSFFLLLSCTKYSSQQGKDILDRDTISTENKKKHLVENQNNWKLEKIFSLSPQSDYSCILPQYENTLINIKNDSIFINNKYTDDVYNITIPTKSYFNSESLYKVYKKRIKEELKVNIPTDIKTIRNKRAYDKNSLLDKYFQDAFFINEYLIFENNGCIICFKKANEKRGEILHFKNIILPYKKSISINSVVYDTINTNIVSGLNEWSCEEFFSRYIPLLKKNDISIILSPQDCGDFPYRFYLLTIKESKIIDNLYVEGEWYENIENKEFTSFEINEDTIIIVKKKWKGEDLLGSSGVKKYQILENGKIKQIL